MACGEYASDPGVANSYRQKWGESADGINEPKMNIKRAHTRLPTIAFGKLTDGQTREGFAGGGCSPVWIIVRNLGF
jgi:hypothetical protein